MAYWGQAMSLYHELWCAPSEKDLAEGWQLVQRAQGASEASPRELQWERIQVRQSWHKQKSSLARYPVNKAKDEPEAGMDHKRRVSC